jgi:hypothetical protein
MFEKLFITKDGKNVETRLQVGDTIILEPDGRHVQFSRTNTKVNQEGALIPHGGTPLKVGKLNGSGTLDHKQLLDRRHTPEEFRLQVAAFAEGIRLVPVEQPWGSNYALVLLAPAAAQLVLESREKDREARTRKSNVWIRPGTRYR